MLIDAIRRPLTAVRWPPTAVRCATAAALIAAAVVRADAQPVVLLDVPYIQQSEALCGGAAAAMVMRFWGAAGVYAESFDALVDRATGGIRGEELLSALQARGWDARSFRGDRDSVRAHLAKRRPVVALIEDRPSRFHYVVVVAWPQGRVVLHDPARAPFRVLDDDAFMRAWERSGSWTMLVLPGATMGDEATAPLKWRATSEEVARNFSSAPRGGSCAAMVDEAVKVAAAGDRTAARSLLEIAADVCPRSPGPWRELAGLDALDGAWRNAVTKARRATTLDSGDEHAWRTLATALYVEGDKAGALEAWNRVGEPRVDLVNIEGLDRTRFGVAANAIGIAPQTMLTPDALMRAGRRLSELPVARAARVGYEPGENGLVGVSAVVIERPLLPTSTAAIAAGVVRLLADREVAVTVAGPTGGGERWHVSWRWWDRRPRIAAGISAPAPFGGTWGIEVFDERQTYGHDAGLFEERRRGVVFDASDWITSRLRLHVGTGVDRWSRGRGAFLRGGMAYHLLRDTLVLSADGTKWFGAVDPWTFRARGNWRSSAAHEGSILMANAGLGITAKGAPSALWHGAGTGQVADVLLRAHPMLHSGVVDGAVFGTRLVHGGAEWRRWFQPRGTPLRIAPAIFVDAARATHGAMFTDRRTHIDAGTGLRVPLPGAGVLRVDVARGLRNGNTAFSIGWAR